MRILFVVAALFMLSGCETLASDYGNGHHSRHISHISYTLGFYSGHHYNGYSVYGDHGSRYYYAPRHYSGHRYYARPHHYVQPRRHHYVQPRRQQRHQPRHRARNDTHVTPPTAQRQIQNRRIERKLTEDRHD